MTLSKDELTKIVKQITSNSFEGVAYKLQKITPIQEGKDYQGLRITISANLGNIRDIFHIGITTGERVIPKEIYFYYQPLLGTEKINMLIYPPERILAEKLQTILERGLTNSRMKDFYDCYILNEIEIINKPKLTIAFRNVIKERNSNDDWQNWKAIIDAIFASGFMKSNWILYQNKNEFAKDTSWDIIQASIINELRFLSTQ